MMHNKGKVLYSTKWGKILANFLASDKEIIRIYDPASGRNTAKAIHNHCYTHGEEIGYTQRGNYVYIYKLNITTIPIEEVTDYKYD